VVMAILIQLEWQGKHPRLETGALPMQLAFQHQ
jgi:hypothetical protein